MALSPAFSGACLGLLAFGAYSGYDAAARFLGTGYSPLQIIAAAGLMTMPLLLAYVMLDRQPGNLRPVRPGLMALRSLGTVVNFIAGVTAFTLLPLAQAYVIFFTMPILIALLAIPFLGERIDPVRGIAVAAGLAGVVIALDPGQTPLTWGHGAALLGALSGAMNYVILRKTGAVERAAALLVWPQLALFLVVAAAMPFVYVPMSGFHLGIAALMAVALFAGVLLIQSAYRRAPAIVVAPMQYSQILWASLFGAFLFDEYPGPRILAGGILIALAGLAIVARQDRPEAAAAEPG